MNQNIGTITSRPTTCMIEGLGPVFSLSTFTMTMIAHCFFKGLLSFVETYYDKLLKSDFHRVSNEVSHNHLCYLKELMVWLSPYKSVYVHGNGFCCIKKRYIGLSDFIPTGTVFP